MLREFPSTVGEVKGALDLPLVESLLQSAILHEPSQIPGYEQVMQTLDKYMEPSKHPQSDVFPDILRNLLKGADNSVGVVMSNDSQTADFVMIPVGEEDYMFVPIFIESGKPDCFWLLGKHPVEFSINPYNGELKMEHKRVDRETDERTSSKIEILPPQHMILTTDIKSSGGRVQRITNLAYTPDHKAETMLVLSISDFGRVGGEISRKETYVDEEKTISLQTSLHGLRPDERIDISGDPSNTEIALTGPDLYISVRVNDGFDPVDIGSATKFIDDLRTNPAEVLPAMSRMVHTAAETAKLT